MPKMYNEDGEVIYAGRGKRSFRARALIAQRKAYVRNDEGQLVVYVPEITHASQPARSLGLGMDEEVRAFKRKARALGGQISMGLNEIEIRQTTEYGELIAHLRQLTQPTLVAGLDTHQAAKLVQTLSYWMLRYGLTVFEHDEIVRNLHALINPMRAPVEGGALANRQSNLQRDSAVNTVPGQRTTQVHDELWVHAFLPPNRHPCRPSVVPFDGEQGHSDPHHDGRVWMDDALPRGAEFVCENLSDASNLSTFQRGRHGIIRVFLPYNPDNGTQQPNPMDMHRDRRPLRELDCNRNNEPWSHCLQRFIDACAAVKNSVRSDLRLFIHRGVDTPQEVTL